MKSRFFRRNSPLPAPRVLRVADAIACAHLHAASFAHPWPDHEIEALLADRSCLSDALELGGTICGFILSRQAVDEAEILTIVVDPTQRAQGLGARLLTSHLAHLAAKGVAALFLEVDESNKPALALYRRHGFVQVGLRKAYYALPDGTRANALVMRRALT